MNTIVIGAAILTLVGGNASSPITKLSIGSLSNALSASTLRFPATRSEADSYKLTNPAWKAETLRYLADGIHRAHTSTTGSSTVDLDRYDAMGAAVILASATLALIDAATGESEKLNTGNPQTSKKTARLRPAQARRWRTTSERSRGRPAPTVAPSP